MLMTFTTIIEIAGVNVSPAPRKHALATIITVRNGTHHVSIRRYDSANVDASADNPVSTIHPGAQTHRPVDSPPPTSIAAETLCPHTPLMSRRCRAPRAREISAVDPVPTAATISPMNHSRYEIVPTAAVADGAISFARLFASHVSTSPTRKLKICSNND